MLNRSLPAACSVVAAALMSATWWVASTDAGVAQPQRERDRIVTINEAMGLAHSSILQLEVVPGAAAPETLVLFVNGQPLVVRLHEHSVRHESYRVLAQIEDGSFVEVPPTPVNTLRGSIVGHDEAVVSGSMEEHGLHLRLILEPGHEYWVEPLRPRFRDAAANEYVVYHIDDVLECGGACGGGPRPPGLRHQPFLVDAAAPGSEGGGNEGGAASGGIKIAELACDADYEYYVYWGSSVSNVQNRINAIINANNLLYEAQTGLTHHITTIIVRTSLNQPYTHKNASNLLNQFRSHWNANHGNVQRDMAHLFTGKSLSGGTIGIAWVGVVCNLSYAYALSQSDFSPNFACVTDLTAHELGHNWNAPHCSCPNHTMNPYITCANDFHQSSINTIVQFANSISCLDEGGDPPPPDGTGACCTYLNGCVVTTADNCAAEGGLYLGDGTSCAVQEHGCPPCEVQDCNGTCAPEEWIGDGICDNGSYAFKGVPIFFNCDEFDCDGGDCVCDDPSDPPGDPVSMSVASISLSTINAGQGNRKGQAVVTIVDDLGQPVQGASVTGTFGGDFNETHTAVTNAQGQATLQTDATKKGNVKFSFCVDEVAHAALVYEPGNNAVTCAQ